VKIKILIGFFQVVMALEGIIEVNWPSMWKSGLDPIRWISLNWYSVDFISCILQTTYFERYTLQLIFPPVILLALPCLVRCAGLQKRDKPWCSASDAWRWSFMLLFIVYPQCSEMAFSFFSCKQLSNGNEYLNADYDTQCWTGTHAGYIIPGIIFVILYPLGFPIYIFSTLWRQHCKGHLFDKAGDVDSKGRRRVQLKRTRNWLGFMYADYNSDNWFFEVVLLLWKCFFTGVLEFIEPILPIQLATAAMICGITGFIFVAYRKPYLEPTDNALAVVTHASLLGIIFLTFHAKVLMHVGEEPSSGVDEHLRVLKRTGGDGVSGDGQTRDPLDISESQLGAIMIAFSLVPLVYGIYLMLHAVVMTRSSQRRAGCIRSFRKSVLSLFCGCDKRCCGANRDSQALESAPKMKIKLAAFEATIEVAEFNLLCEEQILRVLGALFAVGMSWEHVVVHATWKDFTSSSVPANSPRMRPDLAVGEMNCLLDFIKEGSGPLRILYQKANVFMQASGSLAADVHFFNEFRSLLANFLKIACAYVVGKMKSNFTVSSKMQKWLVSIQPEEQDASWTGRVCCAFPEGKFQRGWCELERPATEITPEGLDEIVLTLKKIERLLRLEVYNC